MILGFDWKQEILWGDGFIKRRGAVSWKWDLFVADTEQRKATTTIFYYATVVSPEIKKALKMQ